jgi:hypothetical protein
MRKVQSLQYVEYITCQYMHLVLPNIIVIRIDHDRIGVDSIDHDSIDTS